MQLRSRAVLGGTPGRMREKPRRSPGIRSFLPHLSAALTSSPAGGRTGSCGEFATWYGFAVRFSFTDLFPPGGDKPPPLRRYLRPRRRGGYQPPAKAFPAHGEGGAKRRMRSSVFPPRRERSVDCAARPPVMASRSEGSRTRRRAGLPGHREPSSPTPLRSFIV